MYLIVKITKFFQYSNSIMPFQLAGGSLPKQKTSYPYHIASFFYCGFIVTAHAHGESRKSGVRSQESIENSFQVVKLLSDFIHIICKTRHSH